MKAMMRRLVVLCIVAALAIPTVFAGSGGDGGGRPQKGGEGNKRSPQVFAGGDGSGGPKGHAKA